MNQNAENYDGIVYNNNGCTSELRHCVERRMGTFNLNCNISYNSEVQMFLQQ